MFYTVLFNKKQTSLFIILLGLTTISLTNARTILRNADVLQDQEIYFENSEEQESPQELECLNNDAIVHGSTLLFLGGLAITELLKNSSFDNTYKTGELMQLFGGWGLLFGSDNILSNTPRVVRILAALYYYTRNVVPEAIEQKA